MLAELAPKWRAAALRATTVREELQKTPMLMHQGSAVAVADAANLHVQVLCADDKNNVALGLFKMPGLPSHFAVGPKGACSCASALQFAYGTAARLDC